MALTQQTEPAAPRGCTCFKLRSLNRRVTAVYDRALAPAQMRVTQYSLLAQLRRLGGASMSALADAMEMDRTTLTRNLKPLLEAGWIEVALSEQDARVRTVRLTAAGEAQFQTARAHWRRAQSEVNATVGAADLSLLHELIERCLPLFRPADGESE
jgi:DNA-binding MarR family transcriptional regulator